MDDLSLRTPNLRVDWDNIGEGLSGDFDSSNPADLNLLRFTVYERGAQGWQEIDSASYCTRVPADTPQPKLIELLGRILGEVEAAIDSGASVKRTCEELSWLDPEIDSGGA